MPSKVKYHEYLHTLQAIKTLMDAAQGGADASQIDELAEAIKQGSHHITGAILHSAGRPFVLGVHQLDTTQPEQFGYGSEEWRVEWEKLDINRRNRKKEFPHNLSAYRNLCYFVTTRKDILKSPDNFWGLIPEISKTDDRRRCMFVKSTGIRCCNYGLAPICNYHINLVKAVPRMSDKFLESIKSETLKTAYLAHLRSKNYRDVRSEIALMRSMLDALLHRLEGSMHMNDIPIEMIGAITTMCQKITGTVEQSVAIEQKLAQRLSVEQVMSIIFKVMENIMTICEPTHEQALKLAEVVENIPFRTVASLEDPSAAEVGFNLARGNTGTTIQTKYTEDGQTINEGLSKEEVKEEREWVNGKFLPTKARMEAQMAMIERAKNEVESSDPKTDS